MNKRFLEDDGCFGTPVSDPARRHGGAAPKSSGPGMNNPHDLDALVRMLEHPWTPTGGVYCAVALAYETFAVVVPRHVATREGSVPLMYSGEGSTPRLARMRAMRACILGHARRAADGREPQFSAADMLYYNAVLDQWARDLFGDNMAITRGVPWHHWKATHSGAARYRVRSTSTGRQRGGGGAEGQLLVTYGVFSLKHPAYTDATPYPSDPFDDHTRTAREFVESFQVVGYSWPAEPGHLLGQPPTERP